MSATLRGALPLAFCIAGLFASVREVAADPLDAATGKALFDRNWIPAPSSTNGSDGLGPLFNARSCSSCHGRGGGARVVERPDGVRDIKGAVIRLGHADGTTDPYYGLQLQSDAVPSLTPEARVAFLPKPKFELLGPPLDHGIKAGARLAPSLFGRAAFNDVPDEEILKREDPDDRNGDGIKGRANRTVDGIGRYGWKAAHVTLVDQVASAFAIDIGLSSPKAPLPYGDCTVKETTCLAAANGESPTFEGREITTAMLNVVAAYLVSLRPKPPATEGSDLFTKSGCAACHVPELLTRQGKPIPAFTDLLLHDMGPALDDGVGEPGVKSSQWRTAPLIRGDMQSSGHRYLHDGSAADVAEAVSKHGGEAERARKNFEALTEADKHRLIDYVNGL